MAQGPLNGIKVVEFAGLGPAPFCCMLLSDMGAEVVTIDRKGSTPPGPTDVTGRGRLHLASDLKDPVSVAACRELAAKADILIEGFRPGVMERLGLGPDLLLQDNPALVYGRMTGWGQSGPYSQMAGHDINYIAITGALHAIGPADTPVVPLNLIGDFGGGALYLALGVVAALHHARATGQGQVVDCAISDGTASLMAMQYGLKAAGLWADQRASNLIDGGSHYYGPYRCADGAWISLGAVEPQFYRQLLELLEIDDPDFAAQNDASQWPSLRAKLETVIAAQPRSHWIERLGASDACFAPVLSMSEAPDDLHNHHRGTFVTVDDVVQPAPAPRFSATPSEIQRHDVDADFASILFRWTG